MTVPARLDASMTLLREVMERPLDPGYAAAAARPPRTGRFSVAVTVLLAVLAGWMFTVAVAGVREPRPEAARASEKLRVEIERRSAGVRQREDANAALRERIAASQAAALGGAGAALVAQARELGVLTGELPVDGRGVLFTVDDAPGSRDEAVGADPRAAEEAADGIVLDSDLQILVNGLWAAGAEAVAINGQRLTSLSAIRSAGQAILVDFRPLSPPYRIEAVGDPARLQTDFAAGAAGAYVQSLRDNNRIGVDIAVEDSLRLPGAGRLVLREASPVPSAAASPSASASSSPSSSPSSSTDSAPEVP